MTDRRTALALELLALAPGEAPEYPLISPISFLVGLVDEFKAHGPHEDDKDPLATIEAVQEAGPFLAKAMDTLTRAAEHIGE